VPQLLLAHLFLPHTSSPPTSPLLAHASTPTASTPLLRSTHVIRVICP
jgi:hypothetical protein